MDNNAGLKLYNSVALATAGTVIRSYSTSFSLASRLLGRPVRSRIETVYALVRLADEIVDGTAAAANLESSEISALLDALEHETEAAMLSGYSSNLVVHAFALTAREVGIGTDLTRPFFRSMKADLLMTEHTQETFKNYVYGSAEVVGLMCLNCFLLGKTVPPETLAILTQGAQKLGAAFQKVNFLRDLAEDFQSLGRSYFPDIQVQDLTERDKDRLLADIEADLAVSAAAIPYLPRSSKAAVAAAQALFAELARRLHATPASTLLQARVRVPNAVKLRLAARAVIDVQLPGRRNSSVDRSSR